MPNVHRAVIDAATAELGWRPDEFGLRWAVLLACLPVGGGLALIVALLSNPAVPPPPPVIVQLIEPAAASASLAPAQTPAAEPELAASVPPVPLLQTPAPVEPEPQALPALAMAPVAQLLPQRPPRARPTAPRRPSLTHADASAPAAPSLLAVPATAPAARVAAAPQPDTSSGIGPYRAGLHTQIERNMLADESVRRAGVTGVATIEAVIAPDGRVLSTAVTRSSGNRVLDRAAQLAVQRGGYPPFGPHMPPGPITISVPITVGDG